LARRLLGRVGDERDEEAKMLEILAGPFFALIDAALDRPALPIVAAAMLGFVVTMLLMAR
jgi:hypothetical protein